MDKVVKAIKQESAIEPAPEKKQPIPAPVFIDAGDIPTDSYDLKYPLNWNDEDYRTVTFSPMRGSAFGEMAKASLLTTEDVALIFVITRLPIEVINALHADDFVEVLERCDPFVPARFAAEKTES